MSDEAAQEPKHTITFTLPVEMDHVKLEIVKSTVAHYHGDKRAAARALGISLKTVYNTLERSP